MFTPSLEWATEMQWSIANANADNLRPFLDIPRYLYGGMEVSGDASTADGWGFHIGPFFASGLWDPATLEAIARSSRADKEEDGDRISISPLELWVQALIAHVLGHQLRFLLDEGGQFVARCDNQSSCTVADTLRPKSPAMGEALAIKVEQELTGGVRGRLQYIPTLENKIADLLSLGRVEAARQLMAIKWGQTFPLVIEPQFIDLSLARVREAFSAASAQGM